MEWPDPVIICPSLWARWRAVRRLLYGTTAMVPVGPGCPGCALRTHAA